VLLSLSLVGRERVLYLGSPPSSGELLVLPRALWHGGFGFSQNRALGTLRPPHPGTISQLKFS
jgi:hypothetical protein